MPNTTCFLCLNFLETLILEKICGQTFRSSDLVTTPAHMLCPHCWKALVPKKEHKHFILHKCVNPKCPYNLYNLKKVDKANLKEDYGENKFHYIYREFTIDFFSMDFTTLPKNASSLEFSKHNAHVFYPAVRYACFSIFLRIWSIKIAITHIGMVPSII